MERELETGRLAAWRGRRGERLRVLRGRLLVTQEGMAGDFDLGSGDSLALEGEGRVVAEALAPSAWAIEPPPRWWCEWWLAALARPSEKAPLFDPAQENAGPS